MLLLVARRHTRIGAGLPVGLYREAVYLLRTLTLPVGRVKIFVGIARGTLVSCGVQWKGRRPEPGPRLFGSKVLRRVTILNIDVRELLTFSLGLARGA